MPAIIDSSPSCVTNNEGGEQFAEDGADFILQANFQDCAGFMTFGPGSTYGDEGAGAETAYMILTWLGIIAMLVALVAWVLYENRRLIAYSLGIRGGGTAGVPPQPGGVGDSQ